MPSQRDVLYYGSVAAPSTHSQKRFEMSSSTSTDPLAKLQISGDQPFDDDDVLTEGPRYNETPNKTRVRFYRSALSREELAQFNRRSNFLGFLQTIGYLTILGAGAGTAIYSASHWPWYVTGLLVFANGHIWQFLVNGFHELIHDSVFKTRWLNQWFLRLFSFLGWHNQHHFWASHTEHHKYTLHPPDDQEVVFPATVELAGFYKRGIVQFKYPFDLVKNKLRHCRGHIPGDSWTQAILPETDPERRRAFVRWERILLFGHFLIAGFAVVSGHWIVLFVITFPKMFGKWLQSMCNSAQHVGLTDNVPDFRLSCRTIYLNPIVRFLYWHMNYHIEHHMYAAVPCYRLGKLHRRIKHDLPWCPNGLYETWTHIADIQRKQEQDPDYQYLAELPVHPPS